MNLLPARPSPPFSFHAPQLKYGSREFRVTVILCSAVVLFWTVVLLRAFLESKPVGLLFLVMLALFLWLIARQLEVIRSQYELILDSQGIWLLSRGKPKQFCSWERVKLVGSYPPKGSWLDGNNIRIQGISPTGAKLEIVASELYWRESQLKQLLRILASYAERYSFQIQDELKWLK